MTTSTKRPVHLEVNCITGEERYIELTDDEIAQMEIDRAEYEAAEAQKKEREEEIASLKASAKAKLIAGEPLTEEEASVIVL